MKLIKNIRHDHGEANGGTGDEKNDIKNVSTYTWKSWFRKRIIQFVPCVVFFVPDHLPFPLQMTIQLATSKSRTSYKRILRLGDTWWKISQLNAVADGSFVVRIKKIFLIITNVLFKPFAFLNYWLIDKAFLRIADLFDSR